MRIVIEQRSGEKKLNDKSYLSVERAWAEANTIGIGFPPTGRHSINDLGAEFGTLIHRSDRTDELAVYQSEHRDIAAVGDANGPWAVYITNRPTAYFYNGQEVTIIQEDVDGISVIAPIEGGPTQDVKTLNIEVEYSLLL